MKDNHFIFNEDLCVGCEACVVACTIENNVSLPLGWRKIYTTNSKKLPGLPMFNLSLACNHCDDPPCLNFCPANAYEADEITGAVLINSTKCIGCKYCTWNCPYDSPKFNTVTGVIEKCTFCNSRIVNDMIPACANLCPTGALDFSGKVMQEAENNQSSIPEAPGPAIIIVESPKRSGVIVDNTLFKKNQLVESNHQNEHSFTSIKEWPLILFTFITITLVSISATFEQSSYNNVERLTVSAAIFIAGLASILHLGKKLRLLKSVINIRRSWLSREIVFFGLFALLNVIDMWVVNIAQSIIVLTGLATVLSMDMIYKPLQLHWKHQVHSGQALMITIAVFMILNGFYLFLGIFLVLRLFYTLVYFRENVVLMVLRYLFPLKAILILFSSYSPQLAIGLFIAGEFLDRLLFYSDLKKPELSKYN